MKNEEIHPDLERTNDRLKALILRGAPDIGKQAAGLKGVYFSRRVDVEKRDNCFYSPSVGVIVQGSKRSVIGSEEYRYGKYSYLVTGVDVPGITYLTEASEDNPFLAMSITLDKMLICDLMAEIPATNSPDAFSKGFAVAPVEYGLLDAFARLAELIEDSAQVAILGPMVIREIHTRLLMGPCGALLRSLNTAGSQSNQVAKAISWLRDNYSQPVQVEDLAQMVNMAPSTFHRHFRQVTTISPLQFQKRLRLHEAQRLMLSNEADANFAALAVGYESVSQFNREYKRLFGDPPLRNVKRLAAAGQDGQEDMADA